MKFVVWALGIVFSFSIMASETVEGAKKDYEKFKQSMTVKLQEIDKKIADLKEDSKEKGQTAKQQTISELESARDKLKSDLKEVQKMSAGTWERFKTSFADSVDSLNDKVQKALR